MRALAISLAASLALSAAATTTVRSQAIEDDGWEVASDAAGQTIAAARYDNGLSLVARCQQNAFDVLILGLPTYTEPRRTIELDLVDVGEVINGWSLTKEGTVAYSRFPERLAQALIGGGRLNLTIRQGEGGPATRYPLDLPSQGKGLETTLAACNRPVMDPRFQTRADLLSMVKPDEFEWLHRAEPQYPSPTSATSGEVTVLCSIKPDGRLQGCTIESERPAGAGFGRAVLAATGMARLKATSPDIDFEGQWISFTTRFRLQ